MLFLAVETPINVGLVPVSYSICLIFEAPHIAALRYSKENSWKMWMFNFEKARVTEGFDEWIALRKCTAPKMSDAGMFFRFVAADLLRSPAW